MSNLRIPSIPTLGMVYSVLNAPEPRPSRGRGYVAPPEYERRDREICARYDSGQSALRIAYIFGLSVDYVFDIVSYQREMRR